MAKKVILRDRKTGEKLIPVGVGSGGVEIVKVDKADGEVDVEPGKYYLFMDDPETVSINIFDDHVSQDETACLALFFRTGANPTFKFYTTWGREVKYFSGFTIKPNTTYELNLMFNGENWIVAYATVE